MKKLSFLLLSFVMFYIIILGCSETFVISTRSVFINDTEIDNMSTSTTDITKIYGSTTTTTGDETGTTIGDGTGTTNGAGTASSIGDGTGTTNGAGTSTTTNIEPNPIIYVSATGNDNNDGSAIKPYRTIQKAVDIINSFGDNIINSTIYVTTGEYSELINITSPMPMSIKGGYDSNFGNVIGKSLINGTNLTTYNIGRITAWENSKVTLENLDIKGCIYNNSAYGIYSYGDLIINNCDIVGVESGTCGFAYGVRGNNITITDGTITGASGNVSFSGDYSSFACGVCGFTIEITGGTITGASDNVTFEERGVACGVYGYYNSTIEIKGGTITGATGEVKFKIGDSCARGVYSDSSPTIEITGGTITGASDNVTFDEGGDACGVYSWGNITITGGTITGASGNVSFSGDYSSFACGVWCDYLRTIEIKGGTITGASGEVKFEHGGSAFSCRGGSTVIISNCEIYAKESSVLGTVTPYAIRDYAKLYKGTDGDATIQDIKGQDPNYWEYAPGVSVPGTDFQWDVP